MFSWATPSAAVVASGGTENWLYGTAVYVNERTLDGLAVTRADAPPRSVTRRDEQVGIPWTGPGSTLSSLRLMRSPVASELLDGVYCLGSGVRAWNHALDPAQFKGQLDDRGRAELEDGKPTA
jgi:hypothetical protein